jgi:ParB family chromosome partitioning protein
MPVKAAASDRELTAMERLLALNRKSPGKPSRPAEAEIRSIPLAQLAPNPNQPRRAFDDASLDELAESIRARGVIQPLLVRPHATEAERFEIVVGERRFVAAGRAGLAAVPCIVRPLDERETFILSIAENVAREDLSPLDEAAAYRRMLDAGYAAHQGEIAQLIGVHRTRVNHKLRLLELDPRIQEHIRQNPGHTLSMTHLEALARLKPGDPQFSLYLAAVEQDISSREIQTRVEALLTRDAPRPTAPARSAFVLESGARVVVYPNRYVVRIPRPPDPPLDLPHIIRDLEGILVELRSRLEHS